MLLFLVVEREILVQLQEIQSIARENREIFWYIFEEIPHPKEATVRITYSGMHQHNIQALINLIKVWPVTSPNAF